MDIDRPSTSSSSTLATTLGQAQTYAWETPSAADEPASPAPTNPEPYNAQDGEPVDRRRDKPQLSCTFCRRRKVRCDRQFPCKTCVNKGIAFSCTYRPDPKRKGTATTSVGDRIQQLEALVRSLLQQQQTLPTQTAPPSGSFGNGLAQSPRNSDTPDTLRSSVSVEPGANPSVVAAKDEILDGGAAVPSFPQASSSVVSGKSPEHVSSPSSSEHGSIPRRLHSHSVNYVSSVHWAAVLDSISELKDHYEMEKEEEARMLATDDYMPLNSPGPRLFYEPVQATREEILASIPARPAVDRMVARYFNAQGVAPALLHSGQFLQQYENFWQDSSAASFTWIGLLFSIMCISTQLQKLTDEQADADNLRSVHLFRDRVVHCLVLGQFTRGGPYVLETMINYLGSEMLLCKDADPGLWLLMGTLVQLALSLGYHRDPAKFPNITPFAGEMRRRVWATIVQMDLRLSTQIGLPRLLKSQQCDTAEPRNLLDTDLDEDADELPPSRPETEVTPVLYGLAKTRIDRIGGLISDLIADTREHPYSEIMELHKELQEAEATLPPIFRWQPLSQSFMVPPQILLYRIWLQLAIQRLVIWLHRKYLAPSQDHPRCQYSQGACVQAAIKILEFQQLVEDEMQPGGQLYPVRWMQSSLIQSPFLLGMSVLCYYLQLAKTTPDVPLDADTAARIRELLHNTYPMWVRSSTVSRDAREAVEHLSLLLGLRDNDAEGEAPSTRESADPFASMPQDASFTLDSISWDTYQECISNFNATFGVDCIELDESEAPSSVPIPLTDPMLGDTADPDGWMGERLSLR